MLGRNCTLDNCVYLGLELDWLQCELLLELGVAPEIVLLIDLEASFVKGSHRWVLDPCDYKCAFLVVTLAEKNASLGEECIRVSILQLISDDNPD